MVLSKIEKVPRGIRGEKSSKDMANSRNLVSTIGAQASPTILSKFWRQILYITFNKDTFVFLHENLGRLTLFVETQHMNYLSVGSISLHNLGIFVPFVEPYWINFAVSSTRKNISMFVDI